MALLFRLVNYIVYIVICPDDKYIIPDHVWYDIFLD